MAWKPINTSPRDKVFDVWCANTKTRHVDCAWEEMNWGWQINPDQGIGRFLYGEVPSHWMFAPTPPRAKKRKKGT